MVQLSEMQRKEVESLGGKPLPIMDAQSQRLYYLITAEQFEQVRALFADEPFEPRELYPLIAKTAAEAGWAHPSMDDYDRYDEINPTG